MDATLKQTPAGTAGGHWLPASGHVVAGRFRVERVIGEGGMGAVVAAEDASIGGKVAIKFLHPHLAQDLESLERFVREAKVAAQIRSEHVVRVLDVGSTPEGLPYIVMDLLEGSDLGAMVKATALPIQLAVDCILQASEALAEAHAQGIVHRDIKPANLWLAKRRDGTPSVKVLDFGISKLIPSDRESAGITDTKASFGSPAYMSPEQIRSAKRVDHRTDVFALGVVLFELLTTKLPFDAESVAGILAAIISDPPLSLGRLRPEALPELERIVRGMLEKDPSHRLSLAEVASGLAPFAGPAGRISAERIIGMATPIPSLIPPVATPHSSEDMIALGKTEPSLVQTTPTTPKSNLLTGLLLGLGVSVVFATIGIGVVVSRQKPTPPTPGVVSEPPAAPVEAAPVDPHVPQPSHSAVVAAPSTSVAAPKPINTGRHRPAPAPAPNSPWSEDRH